MDHRVRLPGFLAEILQDCQNIGMLENIGQVLHDPLFLVVDVIASYILE